MARRRRPPRPGAIAELPPLRILGQIAALQGVYYAAALVLMLFTTLVAGSRFSLDLVFGWASLRGDTTQGWLMGFVWLCCAGVTYVYFPPPLPVLSHVHLFPFLSFPFLPAIEGNQKKTPFRHKTK